MGRPYQETVPNSAWEASLEIPVHFTLSLPSTCRDMGLVGGETACLWRCAVGGIPWGRWQCGIPCLCPAV
eukprot:7675624-Alexandrium_andersonii.AAC.1